MVAVRLFVQGCVAPPALMTGGLCKDLQSNPVIPGHVS